MKKITVEARLLDRSLGYNFYETVAVDAEDGREAMLVVHSLLVGRYRTDAFINRLQVVDEKELNDRGNKTGNFQTASYSDGKWIIDNNEL